MYAANNGHLKIVKCLVENKADVNIRNLVCNLYLTDNK
jgi:ankyrin repeat protein